MTLLSITLKKPLILARHEPVTRHIDQARTGTGKELSVSPRALPGQLLALQELKLVR